MKPNSIKTVRLTAQHYYIDHYGHMYISKDQFLFSKQARLLPLSVPKLHTFESPTNHRSGLWQLEILECVDAATVKLRHLVSIGRSQNEHGWRQPLP